MKWKKRKIIAMSALAVLLASPIIVFLCRSPVLIVTDMAFIPLYGEKRIRAESREAAFTLFRPVKTVAVVDEAGDDIVSNAVMGASIKPYCVIFPLRFARSARMYREINPAVPIVILEGRYSEDSNPSDSLLRGNSLDFFIYKTDINTDFYTAGLAALSVNMKKTENGNGRIAVFIESNIQRQAREAFNLALNTAEIPPNVSFFTDTAQYERDPGYTCIVMTGAGVSIFEGREEISVIFFTWIEPQDTPDACVLIFNDSPYAQAVSAVRMAKEGVERGVIPSKIFVKNKQIIDISALHKGL